MNKLALFLLPFTFLYIIPISFAILVPFLDAYFFRRVSFEREVDPEIMNGLLTVSSILFGFSTLLTIPNSVQKESEEEGSLWIVLSVPLILIIISSGTLVDFALGRKNAVETTLYLSSCIYANVFTTGFVLGWKFQPKLAGLWKMLKLRK